MSGIFAGAQFSANLADAASIDKGMILVSCLLPVDQSPATPAGAAAPFVSDASTNGTFRERYVSLPFFTADTTDPLVPVMAVFYAFQVHNSTSAIIHR